MVEVDKLEKVQGIGPVYAEKLKQAVAKTTKDLLKFAVYLQKIERNLPIQLELVNI